MSDSDNFDTSAFNEASPQEGIPKDDTDLSGMNYEQAAEYVLSFVTTLKQSEKLAAEAAKDVDMWKERKTLAESQGKADLAEAARKKLEDAESKHAKLDSEKQDLAFKCSTLVQNLKKLKATGVTRLVDTDRLLADFEMILGENAKDDYTLDQSMKNEEADAELRKLKERMQTENKE